MLTPGQTGPMDDEQPVEADLEPEDADLAEPPAARRPRGMYLGAAMLGLQEAMFGKAKEDTVDRGRGVRRPAEPGSRWARHPLRRRSPPRRPTTRPDQGPGSPHPSPALTAAPPGSTATSSLLIGPHPLHGCVDSERVDGPPQQGGREALDDDLGQRAFEQLPRAAVRSCTWNATASSRWRCGSSASTRPPARSVTPT